MRYEIVEQVNEEHSIRGKVYFSTNDDQRALEKLMELVKVVHELVHGVNVHQKSGILLGIL